MYSRTKRERDTRMGDRSVNASSKTSLLSGLDLYTKIGLAAYGLLMVVRFAIFSSESQAVFDNYIAEPILLGTLVLLLGRRLYLSTETSYRLFYGIVLAGFAIWLSVSLINITATNAESIDVQLYRDLLLMLHTAAIVVAIEFRLDTFQTKNWLQRRSLHAIGGFLLIYAAFSYFAIVPTYAASLDYNTPYILYAALDLFLALRFFTAVSQARNPSWRIVYGTFGVVFALIVAADVLAFLYRNSYLEYDPTSLLNLVWYLWYPAAFIAASIRPTWSSRWNHQTDSQVLGSATGGLLIFGMALPLIHTVGYGFSLFNIVLRDARDVLVAVWIILITVLFSGVYYYITRQISKLDTERAIAEEKATRLEHQLEREIRLRLLGRLSAGLAHDFGNSLFAISTHAKAIEKRYEQGESPVQGLAGLNEAVKYAQELVTKLSLVGAAGTTPSVEYFDIRTEIQKTVEVVTPSLGNEVTLQYRPGPKPIRIRAERSMIQQVLTNFIFNATDAIQRRGRVDVSIETYPVRTHCASCGEEMSGDYAVLTVTDNGPGIDATVKENIFEPLITTKPLGKGSGLGLAMIHAIMHRIGGHVGLRSTPQKGTSFIAYFPI